MKMRMTAFLGIIVAIIAGVMIGERLVPGPPGARTSALDDIVKAKKIRIGIQNEVPPYSQTDANHEPIGYDIDVAKLIAKDMGVELEEVLVSGPNRIPFLLTNKVDLVVATLGITPARALTITFSNPYLAFTSVLMGPKSVNAKSLADAKGLKIGVTRGNFQDDFITKNAPKEAQIMRFEDDSTTIGALVSGQVDLLGFGDLVTNDAIKKNPDKNLENKFVLTSTPAGIAMRHNELDLLRWVNTFIYVHRNDGSLSKLHEQWTGAPLPDLPGF
jgi:polar amino acid transport system substrate-binding protein